MGLIYSKLLTWSMANRWYAPLAKIPLLPIQLVDGIMRVLAYIPNLIISNEYLQLAARDTWSFLDTTVFSTTKFWLLPTILTLGAYHFLSPSKRQVNEMHHFYREHGLNTTRPHHYYYPIGSYAEHLRSV